MTDTPPTWAIEKAREELAREYESDGNRLAAAHVRAEKYDNYPIVIAFARYIAKHEQPPVCPKLKEARRIAAEKLRALRLPGLAEAIERGQEDDHVAVQAALAALDSPFRMGVE